MTNHRSLIRLFQKYVVFQFLNCWWRQNFNNGSLVPGSHARQDFSPAVTVCNQKPHFIHASATDRK
jgi:hypothetical protein